MGAWEMEVMPCQMCAGVEGATAELSDGYRGVAHVTCSNCGAWGPLDPSLDEYYDDRSEVRAVELWNRMQSLIAKGLLIEEEAAASRETKGRL